MGNVVSAAPPNPISRIDRVTLEFVGAKNIEVDTKPAHSIAVRRRRCGVSVHQTVSIEPVENAASQPEAVDGTRDD
jgi:hypothetical protein